MSKKRVLILLSSNTTQLTEHTCLSSGIVHVCCTFSMHELYYVCYFSMHELYHFKDAQPMQHDWHHSILHKFFSAIHHKASAGAPSMERTGWRKSTGCLKLHVSFRKWATNYRALLQKMTYEDEASYVWSPPCRSRMRGLQMKNGRLCSARWNYRSLLKKRPIKCCSNEEWTPFWCTLHVLLCAILAE